MKSKLVYILIGFFAISLLSAANNSEKNCSATSYCCKADKEISSNYPVTDDDFMFLPFNPMFFN